MNDDCGSRKVCEPFESYKSLTEALVHGGITNDAE